MRFMIEKARQPALAGWKYFVYTLFFVQPFLCLAQTGTGHQSLKGKILDAVTQQPIHAATISLLRKDSVVIAGTASHEDGSFDMEDLPDGKFLLRISTIGYQPFTREISASYMGASHSGIVRLTPVATQLQSVVVMGEKAVFKTEIDKKVFNVDRSLASKGGTAADALRQVPTLSIDATGNVTLRNGAPVILVDGKTTTLTLDQIPSDQIQSIEVIPNPSARYDAQGNHGIVNIVMKKNRKPGANGSVTGVWSSLKELYGFLNANIYQNRWNFTINYMAHRHRNVSNTTTNFYNLADNTSLAQHGYLVRTGPFQKIKLGADFFMDAHNTFSLSGDIGKGFHPTVGNTVSEYLNASGGIDSTSTRTNTDADRFIFSHTEFDYTHEFNKQGEKLATGATLETFGGPDNGTYTMQYLDKGGATIGSPYLQQYQSPAHAHTLTVQSDLTDPLRDGSAKLEAGVKATLNSNYSKSNFQDFNSTSKEYITDSVASYDYSYTDNTYAAYSSYSDRIGSKFSYMAGLRMEQYDYTGHLLNNNTQFSFHNTGLYPSLFLTEKAGENGEFHLNYSRRVNRPQWWQITPWTNYSNPQNPQVGNPHIQSENTNLGELSYNLTKGSTTLNTTLYVKNTLSPIISYNIPLTNDTLLSTFRNANSMNTYGAEIIVKVPVMKWWSATTNLNFLQTSINADNLSQGLSNSGFSWFAKLNSEMKLAGIYTFQLTGNYNAPNIVAQGKVLASGGIDVAIKRDFLRNNAGTIILSVSDILNTQEYRVTTSSPGSFIQYATTKPETRVLKVNFTYTFGKEKNGERKKATSVSTD
jgi:iron complex outermembrane recepter protein